MATEHSASAEVQNWPFRLPGVMKQNQAFGSSGTKIIIVSELIFTYILVLGPLATELSKIGKQKNLKLAKKSDSGSHRLWSFFGPEITLAL